MIPTFPNFKKLSLEDKKGIEEHLTRYLPYSDFNFLSIWSYDTADDLIVATLHDNLVLRLRDYITNEPFYTFLGNNNVADTIATLLTHSQNEGLIEQLKLVPEDNIANQFDSLQNYIIEEDRDHFDYIFSVAELSELKGTKYHTQKNHVNRFQREHPHCQIRVINIQEPAVQEQVFDVFYKWERKKGGAKEDTEHELTALQRVLRDASSFDLLSVGIYDNEKMTGFIIADLGQGVYAQSHFAKADTSYFGVFHTLYNALAKELQSRRYEYINNEQDLGIAGLRYAKEQWNPVRFLKKYKISPRILA